MASQFHSLVTSITGAEAVKAAIQSVPARARSRGLWRALGDEIKGQTEERFDLGEEPSGKKWPTSWRVKLGLGGGPTLVKTRDMERSMTVNINDAGGELVVPKVYAATHQFGATIEPVSAKVLKFRLGNKGNKPNFVFARKVTIPARPFLGFSARNIEVIQQVAAEYVMKQAASQGAAP